MKQGLGWVIMLLEHTIDWAIDVDNEECIVDNLAQLMWAYEIQETQKERGI